jgi:aminoglycoside/choline kinase family phosphotransferase
MKGYLPAKRYSNRNKGCLKKLIKRTRFVFIHLFPIHYLCNPKFIPLNSSKEIKLAGLFKEFAGHPPTAMQKLTGSGSNRAYYRITGNNTIVIGTIGENPSETAAFLYFSEHFRQRGLHVPAILAKNETENIYLQEDLGNTSLFELLEKGKRDNGIAENIHTLYKQTVEELIRFQLDGAKGLDYSQCYPKDSFDRQSMMWDLNYFKYYFLKPSGVHFDEQELDDEFELLVDFLLEADSNHFMYRDFQARNILVHDENLWFIDYQGGRKGALQYDLASLLFQAKANLSPQFREEILNHYLSQLSQRMTINRNKFIDHYFGFVLIRMLQVLGAYGYRGFFEQKPHFIESTSYAISNLKWFLDHIKLSVPLPNLTSYLHELISSGSKESSVEKGLTIEINSFSYKKSGIPKDLSGHGGGFVFDCRPLPNPGRLQEFRHLTGNDDPVIQFMEKEPSVKFFFRSVIQLVDLSVENYLERGFNRIMVSFGCTGGQHRSVYFANQLAKELGKKSGIKVLLRHRMQE